MSGLCQLRWKMTKKSSLLMPKNRVFDQEIWIDVSFSFAGHLFCIYCRDHLNKLSILIQIEDTEERSVKTLGLRDSGAGGKLIDQNYAKKMGFKTHKLEKPLQAYNVDGTKNKRGMIKYYVNLNLEINGRKTTMELLVTALGKERIILGFPWLQE